MVECWKQIPWYPDYDISDNGRVRELRMLKPTLSGPIGKQYLQVWLCADEQKRSKVAHLVAEAFIGPRPVKHVVNHKDGNKLNNHYQNLEWTTYGENNLHAYRVLGKVTVPPRGEKCHKAVLTEVTARQMLMEMRAGAPVLDLLVRYQVHKTTAYALKRGATWKHVHQELGG